ncbi:hypothetical protein ACOSQ3_019743 [Xanthoceras sorbifolium]
MHVLTIVCLEMMMNIYGESRYNEINDDSNNFQIENKRIPAKQVRYFPLVPRLQMLFMSSKTSSFMKWHMEGHTNDGVLRHPADSRAWKEIKESQILLLIVVTLGLG